MDLDQLTDKDNDVIEVAAATPGARGYLVLRHRDRAEAIEVTPKDEAVIGRGADVALSIDDSRVSRRHARVEWCDTGLRIVDLGSRNGTQLNGETIHGEARAVRGGDRIRIGGHEVIVAMSSKPTAEEAQAQNPGDLADDGYVVADVNMARTFSLARRVAMTPATVLVLGETGVGKEVVASRIHAWSPRAAERFVRVNCAALPEALVESELFGHERGAFTGAERRKIGLVEAAHRGTLFLDEIGELPLPVQAKLLAVLENRAVLRLGSTVETPVDVRVIAATHRDLSKEVAAGRFREDLYYRIGVMMVRVPALRERPSEIVLLAKLFAKRFGQRHGFTDPNVAADASAALLAHGWPGNIRELRNALEHAMVLTEDGVVRREHLPETVTARPTPGESAPPSASHESSPPPRRGMRDRLAEVERTVIEEALSAASGNRTHAALALGISLRSLLYKLEKYGLGK